MAKKRVQPKSKLKKLKLDYRAVFLVMAALSAVGIFVVFRSHAAAWPSTGNTGVPAGTNLTAYSGPTTITSCGTVIDSKLVSSGLDIRATNGTQSAATPCVTIKNSKILGPVTTSYASSSSCKLNGASKPCGPLLLNDVEIAIPTPNAGDFSGLLQTNLFAWRINIHGARTNIQCDGYCEIHDSYLHDNWFVSPAHMGAFLSNGNGGRQITLDHNTLICNVIPGSPGGGTGGCSADINFYGDFATTDRVTVTNNLFKANPNDFYYCAYSGASQSAKAYPTGTNLNWTGNVWEKGSSGKCGGAGPVADWALNSGNVWCNNSYDDGTKIGSNNCPSGTPAPTPSPTPTPTPTPTPAPTPTPSPTSSTPTPIAIAASPSQKVTVENGVTTVTKTLPQTVTDTGSLELAPVDLTTTDLGANVTVTKAIFFVDNKQLGQTTAAPFNLKLDPYKLRNGTHQVVIRSYTSNGKTVVTKQTLNVYITWYKRLGHWVWTPVRAVHKKK